MTTKEYNEIVMQHTDDLFRFVYKNTGHAEDARDIVQHSFEILWMKKTEVEPEKGKSFLFTIGYRKMIDGLRKKKREQLKDEIPESLGGYSETRQTGLKQAIEEALNALPDIQKQLVLLKDYEGYSYEEMAKITGINESQVKVYLFRARMQLKKSLVSLEHNL